MIKGLEAKRYPTSTINKIPNNIWLKESDVKEWLESTENWLNHQESKN